MKLKEFLLLSSLLCVVSLNAAPDWQPTFKDKPVPASLESAIVSALPHEPIVKPLVRRRILIFSATAGYRHRSIPTAKLAFSRMGEVSGAYETVISDDPKNFELAVLAGFDAVMLLSPTQDFFMPNKRQRKKFSASDLIELQARHDRLVDNLVQYVNEGGGLVGIHAATDACYQHASFGATIGALFDGHPWRADNNVTIVVADPGHAANQPVFGAQQDFQIKEEIYQFNVEPYTREHLRILLQLDPERSDSVSGMKRIDGDYPIAWLQQVGRGRVFYSSLGHNHEIFSNSLILKHYLAGIQFATGDLKADTTPSAKIDLPNLSSDL
jgi:type 1 glutamine amidotransferase